MTTSSSSRRKTHRKCCVRNCTNQAAQGRKTCGKHPRRAASRSVKTTPLHLDRILRQFDRDKFDFQPDPIAASEIFKRRLSDAEQFKPRIRTDAAGRLVSVCLLPTNQYELANLLADFAMRHSLADVERLTPATFVEKDDCPGIGYALIASEYVIPSRARIAGGAASYYREVIG
jgi:hypothetical protein